MKKIIITNCLIITAVIFCICANFKPEVSAQSTAESETLALQQRIDTFFDSILEPSGSTAAYQTMFQGSQQGDVEIQKMVQETDALVKSARWKFDFLDAKRVGSDLILVRYLYKCETHPVVWYFTFYRSQSMTRPTDGTISSSSWNCIGVRFDTDLDSLFKESWPR